MGVERIEVEFAGDEEDDGAQGTEAAVAAGLAFGSLDEAVELGFDSSSYMIGLLGVPGDVESTSYGGFGWIHAPNP